MLKHVISLTFAFLSWPAFAQYENLRTQIRQLVEGRDMLVGVAVIRNGVDTLTINNDNRYPLMSVVKLHQAMAAAHYFHQKNIPLEAQIFVTCDDLRPDTYSPLRDKHTQGNIYLPISDLLRYTLQWSDNNACDVIFRYMNGPVTVDNYIRSLGINDLSIRATEDEMHKDLNTCYQNWSTPLAAAQLIEQLVATQATPSPFREFIIQTLISCETGKERLPRPLAGTRTVIGHKTGTGDRNPQGKIIGVNDVGFVLLPDNTRYSIAVFIQDSGESLQATSQVIGDISEIVYTYFSHQNTNP